LAKILKKLKAGRNFFSFINLENPLYFLVRKGGCRGSTFKNLYFWKPYGTKNGITGISNSYLKVGALRPPLVDSGNNKFVDLNWSSMMENIENSLL
jgi:hypothetical protein